MINRKSIIEQFVYNETQQNTHSKEYLDAIDNETYLEDLVETVATWVRECEGDKNKAMMYIIQTLDTDN
jgi:hypothetical protein